jgi:hypothetical protein
LPAPRFNVIAKPNDWSKVVKRTASNQTASELDILRLEYWQAFKTFMESNNSFQITQKPSQRLYYNISIGRSGFTLCANIRARGNIINTMLWLDGSNHKEKFDELKKNCFEHSISEFGSGINWFRNDDKNSSQILITCDADYTDKEDWGNQFMWFKENLEKFTKFFKPEIEKL